MTFDHAATPDLVLDVTAFQLLRGGKRVKLQKTPMEILMVLAHRSPSLVTRAEIVAAIWGDAVHVDVDSGINTAIRKIRQALDDNSVVPTYIETVVGKGYRFIGPITLIEHTPGEPSEPPSPVAVMPSLASTAAHRLRAVVMGVAVAAAALTVQSDVAVEFVSGLPTGRHDTDRAAAQVAEPYLRGRVELAHEDRRQTPRAYFERALTVDPSYAPARAGLADFYRAQAIAADQGSEQAWRTAEQYASEALTVGANSAEAHVAVAQIRLMHDWDWKAAREHAQRALQLNPNLPDAHAVYARYLRVAGDMHGAVDQRKQAAALDPLQADLRFQLALEQWFAGEVSDAVASAREVLTLDMNHGAANGLLCIALGRLKRFDEAIAYCSKALVLEGHSDWSVPLVQEYRQLGYDGAMRSVETKNLLEILKHPEPDLWDLANAYVLVGKNDEALDTLLRGLLIHQPGLLQIRQDPDFDPIRGDPRYAELIRRIGFPSE